ncbi:MAG TPA: RNA 2',3'-cyclic phosphodiesterase [Accumulibacter sp.]|uniref:RNA 2',3'-cyclic phosphodiesterase n=2 Tax=Candidatus Accumulibacter TaxID=327159 RepID=A0A7D5SBU7_9PROT|nr:MULTISPECIES: RNA 2',3'-cyclic phosphodiesterase [Candidatus Accumulibacter]QLH48758.1 MAG: RNA 2',3'-cyclic phosphodiesterase [Candidatus Accumulibacter cognatus]MBL8399821.1 RNA 2',3'-cyclic phosphodiesterase [Accumulibacter sp.]MBN8516515.1 RNA 2',3'-cyclic phosphodiesterase [Accumulibacter sp.]MBO3713300.1 RNA 2',3'-cyclic phosphodiesterase [Accumulibacter sp.]MCM8579648.1 RNA 2',3'-cyclic phosphodiesterase [Accumulibacter sp.]
MNIASPIPVDPTTGNFRPPSSAQDVPRHARLFLALWPAHAENSALLGYQQQWLWPKGSSPVPAERLHLTLHFIGPVERSRLEAVNAGLQVAMTPFELHLTQAAIWPRGLAVLQASTVPEALKELHCRLGKALQALALPVESRPFRPHVTLARRAAGSIAPSAAPALLWQIDSYVLVESLPNAAGGYLIQRSYS